MPPTEVAVTAELVTVMLSDQWPDYSGQQVTSLTHGWDNYLFRVGEHHVARLPRRQVAVGLVDNESRWLPLLAPHLTLLVPVPRFVGQPAHGYPWKWTVIDWLEGESAALAPSIDYATCALQLGRFLHALHRPAPANAPSNPFRGVPIATRDPIVRDRLTSLRENAVLLSRIWEEAAGVAGHPGPALWIHGDLHPHNLLISGGLLTGVVDFGDIAAGDPATDLAVAWMLLPTELHTRFRNAYGSSDHDLWARARGWALHLALAYLISSADNPTMDGIGRVTLERLLEERSTARG